MLKDEEKILLKAPKILSHKYFHYPKDPFDELAEKAQDKTQKEIIEDIKNIFEDI